MSDLTARAAMSEWERWQHRKAPEGVMPSREFATEFEVRKPATGSLVTVRGYASTTGADNAYEMHDSLGAYSEQIARGAFKQTLSQDPKVQLLENHGGRSMAYTRPKTLVLREDPRGLEFEATVNTERSDVRDMVIALEDGAYSECSFAFRVVKQNWNEDYTEREITEVNLNRGDVSIVNFGANPNTPVSVERGAAIASKLREGRALDAEDVSMLTQAMAWFTSVDSIVDEAQEALAAYLQVPSPDPDDDPVALSAPSMSWLRLRAMALDLN